MTQTRQIPSVTDLKSHRDLRDRGWQSVRKVWLEGGDVDQGFLEAFPGSSDLAQAYEQSVASADNTADVLRDDAEAVARADALRVDVQDQKESLDDMKARRVALDKDRTVLWSKWLKLWEPLGIEP